MPYNLPTYVMHHNNKSALRAYKGHIKLLSIISRIKIFVTCCHMLTMRVYYY